MSGFPMLCGVKNHPFNFQTDSSLLGSVWGSCWLLCSAFLTWVTHLILTGRPYSRALFKAFPLPAHVRCTFSPWFLRAFWHGLHSSCSKLFAIRSSTFWSKHSVPPFIHGVSPWLHQSPDSLMPTSWVVPTSTSVASKLFHGLVLNGSFGLIRPAVY